MDIEDLHKQLGLVLLGTGETSCAVNHHIELWDAGGKRLDGAVVAYVELLVVDARICSVLWLCEVGDHHVRAVLEKGSRKGATDSAGTAGDQNMLTRYAEVGDI